MEDNHLGNPWRPALLTRSFSRKAEGRDEVVGSAVRTAKRAQSLGFFDKILFMVATDRDYGGTVDDLRAAFDDNTLNAEVRGATGNPNSDVLNDGFRYLLGMNMAPLVLSNKAYEFLTLAEVETLFEAINNHCMVAGLSFPELRDVQQFPISNTFAVWNPYWSMEVGGFDAPNGVEEIGLCGRLQDKLPERRRIGVLEIPYGDSRCFNIRSSAEAQTHHSQVIDTKSDREIAETRRTGFTMSYLLRNVLMLHSKS